MYNYLIVGAGLTGAIFAHEAHKRGESVLVIDKRTYHLYLKYIWHSGTRIRPSYLPHE